MKWICPIEKTISQVLNLLLKCWIHSRYSNLTRRTNSSSPLNSLQPRLAHGVHCELQISLVLIRCFLLKICHRKLWVHS